MSQTNLNDNPYGCRVLAYHDICRSRLEMFGGDGKCCTHNRHPNCLLAKEKQTYERSSAKSNQNSKQNY